MRFLEDHNQALLVHTDAWRQTLESSFPHITGEVIALRNGPSGEILAGLPIYRVKSWLLGQRLVSVPFASTCDPLISNAEEATILVARALEQMQNFRAKILEVRTVNTSNFLQQTTLHGTAHHVHHILKLGVENDALLRTFSKSAIQAKIARGKRSKFVVRHGVDLRDIQIAYDLVTETRRRLELPQIPIRFFTALWNNVISRHGRLYLVSQNDRTIACLFVTYFRHRCSVEFSGDARSNESTGANQLIYWQAIADANSSGYKEFSFGRSSLSNESLIQYKRRWGTKEELITTFTSSPVTDTRGREASASYKAARLIARHLPGSLYRHFGSFIYRHLG